MKVNLNWYVGGNEDEWLQTTIEDPRVSGKKQDGRKLFKFCSFQKIFSEIQSLIRCARKIHVINFFGEKKKGLKNWKTNLRDDTSDIKSKSDQISWWFILSKSWGLEKMRMPIIIHNYKKKTNQQSSWNVNKSLLESHRPNIQNMTGKKQI